MPGRKPGEAHAVLDDDAFLELGILGTGVEHVDHALRLVTGLLVARRGLGRVVLERPEDLGDRDLHLGARLHALEHDHAALAESFADPLTDIFVLDIAPVEPFDDRAERKVLAQIAHRDSRHLPFSCIPAVTPVARLITQFSFFPVLQSMASCTGRFANRPEVINCPP